MVKVFDRRRKSLDHVFIYKHNSFYNTGISGLWLFIVGNMFTIKEYFQLLIIFYESQK